MTIATEYVVTVSMYVEKTYVMTGMDKQEAITEAKERLYHEVPFNDPDVKWDVQTEDHTKIVYGPQF